MTDAGSNAHLDGTPQQVTGGGQQPALGIDSGNTGTTPTSIDQVGEANDLDTFRSFVRSMADRHRNGGVSRDDTLSMIASVATYRKLNDTFGDDQICEIIKSEFYIVADDVANQHVQTHEGPSAFPGVITAERLQSAEFAPVMFVVPPVHRRGRHACGRQAETGQELADARYRSRDCEREASARQHAGVAGQDVGTLPGRQRATFASQIAETGSRWRSVASRFGTHHAVATDR
jgi:hypothetical protein